jgi:hypothetical protein
MDNKMTNKIIKLTKKKSKSGFNPQIDELITNYKNSYQEAEDCLLNNLKPVLRKKVLAILNECKKETDNIPFFQKKQSGVRKCVSDKYYKANIAKNVMDIEFGKCMDTLNKKNDLLKGLALLLNPDIKKMEELLNKINEMMSISKKCIDTYCKDISPRNKKKFNQCFEDHKCNEGNIKQNIKHNFNEVAKIEKKTQKLLNKIK